MRDLSVIKVTRAYKALIDLNMCTIDYKDFIKLSKSIQL